MRDMNFADIDSEEILDELIEDLFDTIKAEKASDYILKETHDFTMCLPKSYYGPGSYSNWIRVGWALANTDKRLFLTWLKFSCQKDCRHTLRGADSKFDWSNVQELFELWCSFDYNNPEGLTNKSIMYWCKNEVPYKYKKIKRETIDYYIDQAIQTSTEYDLATVLYHLFKDKYICVSIKNNTWYKFRNHKWYEDEHGNTLRKSISNTLHNEIFSRIHNITVKLQLTDPQSEQDHEVLKKKTKRMAEIAICLKKTTWKNNIMREARELFYDPEFISNIDNNPYLLCFNNGVMDFKEKVFRKGQPDDFITKCTNIDYHKLDKNKNKTEIEEIRQFMRELFPDKDLCKYMWEHLASVLIGTTENQTFNIYTGSGRNGKSCLVELMSKCLGEYKGSVPITLITQKRNSIGSTSSEIVQLMGIRYAVMQEPTKGDQINEGIMKEITGGDPIQGRALFKDSVTFIPQFKLVVCTNSMFDIKSNDDGTWRRIRVCDFMSKFIDKPFEDDRFPRDHFPHQFKLNKKLAEEKFQKWIPVFMGMLCDIACEKQGNVNDCEVVMASSNCYREGQDYLTLFVKDKIVTKKDSKIKKTELLNQFKEWYSGNYGRNVPKGKELYDFMEKRFGRYRNGWNNVAINYDYEDDDDDSDEEDDDL